MARKRTRKIPTLELVWSAPKLKLLSEAQDRELRDLIREINQSSERSRRKRQQEEEPDLPPAA